MTPQTKKLQQLIDDFDSGNLEVDHFKQEAINLARAGADLTVCGRGFSINTLLHCLVLTNENGANNNEIAQLVKIKSNIFNSTNLCGELPLQTLLLKKPDISIDVIKKLITLGNALHYKNSIEENLIHTSCYIGNLELVRYLVDSGLDITSKDYFGSTALHSSVFSNNQDLWQWLYENKVDIDAQDAFKRTALYMAIQFKKTIMVKWLTEHNANCFLKHAGDKTALSFAKHIDAAEDIDAVEEITRLLTNPQYQLFAAIHSLKKYGIFLKTQGATTKGEIAIKLSDDLKSKADEFFQNKPTPSDLEIFQNDFLKLLNSKNHEMSQYRTSWSTIIANIAIALSGIGALFLVGRLIHTQVNQGRPLFFFQKNQTTSEEKVSVLEQTLSSLSSN